MSITLSPEVEERLTEQAALDGCSVNETVEKYVLSGLQIREIEDEIDDLRQSMKEMEEGRGRPMDDVVREVRAKYAGIRSKLISQGRMNSPENVVE
jgi:predicted transcriptional regulator